jgi:hypothetical protein
MRKGWMLYSIATGIAATLIAYVILTLANSVYAGQSQMLDQLSKDGSLGNITLDAYMLSNGAFFLTALCILLLELLCGVLSSLFSRSASGKAEKWYVASLVAGLLPAILYGIFALNNWMSSMSRYESHTNVRPMEPAPAFFVIGLIGFEVAVCLMAAVVGGWLAWTALKPKADDRGS